MKKIIILVIAAAVLLMGAKALIAQKEGKPRQKQKEMLRAERKEKVREEARDQEREQGEDREVVRDRPEGAPEGPQPPAPLPQRPAVQMFDRCLDELTKAYQENDRERMGQLIKRMHQFRQKLQMGRAALGEPLQGRARGWRPDMEEGRPGRFRGPQEGQRDLQPRGMGRMGRPQTPMPPSEDMGEPRPVMPREEMDRLGPDLPSPRGMRGPRPPVPPEEVGPPMGRGFGGMGRGMGRGMGMGRWERPSPPGPWCPCWRYQEEMED